MSTLRLKTAATLLVCVLAVPALASPNGDDDQWAARILNRISRVVKVVKHLLVPTPDDELTPPKP